MAEYTTKSEVWLYPGPAAWHFVSIPKEMSSKIFETHKQSKKSWGSIPVKAKIGNSIWKTSIFPDKKSNTYLLPIKAPIRKKEDIWNGDYVTVTLTIS
jgi:hypothetical protein